MRKSLLVGAGLLFLLFNACREPNPKVFKPEFGWMEQTLPNGWTVYTPKNFRIIRAQGIDSQPGYIKSESDSILIQFDSGQEMVVLTECNFEKQVRSIAGDFDTGFYKEYYHIPEKHTGTIDTIGGIPASVIVPAKVGEGSVAVGLKDCKTGAWIGFDADGLSKPRQDLVLKIIRSATLKGRSRL